jgi:hypothetical protein
MIHCKGYIKHVERDNWENGCTDTVQSYFVSDYFECATKEEAIQYCKDVTGETDEGALDLNSCDEPGRIDIQVQEDENGNRLTQLQWDQFKAGEIDTYLATYSFYFKQSCDIVL